MMKTFYWHDYETWGANPSIDRPSQFAGVRTDESLNVISDPLVIYCQPPVDVWPHPEACLVTGISPQTARKEGLPECDFIAKIHREMAQPGTCTVGYNSLRFDDEVTRYTLFRNYFEPYAREYQYGNSRWDIIDMVRLVYALRPDGIEWPMVDGKPSFRLENLTIANGILHESAHDAYSDVDATIKLAKLIKDSKPELYSYVLANKGKREVSQMIDVERRRPLLHISSRFPSTRGCAGLVAPIAMHPVNRNAVIAFDLSVDPSPMARMSAEEIRERVFTSEADLPEGEQRLPVKLIHLNKCPILATPKLLDTSASERLGIDKQECERNWHTLLGLDVANKLQDMYRLDDFATPEDIEARLYDGFISDQDKPVMQEVRSASPAMLAEQAFAFKDGRLNSMLFPYRARNFNNSLNPADQTQWREWVKQRLLHGSDRRLSRDQLITRIGELELNHAEESGKLHLLQQLRSYVAEISAQFDLG